MAIEGSNTTASRRIRLGMVGGGRDAFIGGVHRIASRIDDRYELVAGAFSSTPEKSRDSAADLGVAADRAYGDYVEMAKREARLKNGIEAVGDRDGQPYALFRVGRAIPQRGIHVYLRQAVDIDARRCAKAGQGGQILHSGRAVRAHTTITPVTG